MFLRISILGGDKRQYYLLLHLIKQLSINHISFSVKCFRLSEYNIPFPYTPCENLSSLLEDCDIFLCPIPFFNEFQELSFPEIVVSGNIPKEVTENPDYEHTVFYDVMKDSHFLRTNSDLTAEGLLKTIIEKTDFSLSDAKCLITGYGRCGYAIAEKLSLLGANVSVYDRDEKKQQELMKNGYKFYDIRTPDHYADFNMVINTIPVPVFKAPMLRKFSGNTPFFDIASAPGGFDESVVRGLNLNLIKCPKIPALTAPKSAGEAISEYIFETIILSLI